jgi:hypothetical protein
MTREEKKQIKQKLPWGWIKIISQKTGFSESYIQKIMNENRKLTNHLIEKKILELAIEHQKKIKDINNLKKSLL